MSPEPRARNPRTLDPQSDELYRGLAERARIEGRQAWLPLLDDRSVWNESPPWAQDQAILAIAEKIGSGFNLINTEVFECGGERHRIASFRFLGPDPKNSLPQKCPLDWLFRLIPGGPYTMGSSDSDETALEYEKPPRQLLLPPLLVAATPTTQAMWQSFDSVNPSHFKGEAHPVETINWLEMGEWTTRIDAGLRLPSEAEWEYACRGGAATPYCYGEDERSIGDYAWFKENSNNQTQPVGLKKPNAFGLYDTHGNVWELCQDTWHRSYAGAPQDCAPWLGGAGEDPTLRVARGGCFFHIPRYCRSACRVGDPPEDRFHALGFRLFRTVD